MIDRLAQLVGRGHGIDIGIGIDIDTDTDRHAGPARRVQAAIKQKAPTSAAGTAERARRHASRPSLSPDARAARPIDWLQLPLRVTSPGLP